jgi:Tfp pilus assembly protein PilE
MVVIAILAILVAVAIPAFTRDTAESKYNQLMDALLQEQQRAKFEAISSKEDRSLLFTSTTAYQLVAMTPGEVTTTNYAQLRALVAPPDTEITGFNLGAKRTPGNTPLAIFPTEIRFSPVSDVDVRGNGLGTCPGGDPCDTSFCACSVTLFLRSTDDRYKHRVVIYGGTGYAERLEGW